MAAMRSEIRMHLLRDGQLHLLQAVAHLECALEFVEKGCRENIACIEKALRRANKTLSVINNRIEHEQSRR